MNHCQEKNWQESTMGRRQQKSVRFFSIGLPRKISLRRWSSKNRLFWSRLKHKKVRSSGLDCDPQLFGPIWTVRDLNSLRVIMICGAIIQNDTKSFQIKFTNETILSVGDFPLLIYWKLQIGTWSIEGKNLKNLEPERQKICSSATVW